MKKNNIRKGFLLIILGILIFAYGGKAKSPAPYAFVYLDWSDGKHYYENATKTDISGYYEMNVAEGEINISILFLHVMENKIVSLSNYTGNFSISGIVWKNITLRDFPNETAKIEGHVYDNDTLQPIQNAKITITSFSDYFSMVNITETDSSGYYEINLPPSDVIILAQADGYCFSVKINITVADGETKIIDMYLEPLTAVIKGYIRDVLLMIV